MSAIYQPCTPACSDNGAYQSFLGGTAVSWQQLTSENDPCRVGFTCLIGGIPATVWIDDRHFTAAIDHPIHPEHPDHPIHPQHPTETPEPGTWALVGMGLGLLGLRRRA